MPQESRWQFALFPAVTMSLGWGLRGYIGGGPFLVMAGYLTWVVQCSQWPRQHR